MWQDMRLAYHRVFQGSRMRLASKPICITKRWCENFCPVFGRVGLFHFFISPLQRSIKDWRITKWLAMYRGVTSDAFRERCSPLMTNYPTVMQSKRARKWWMDWCAFCCAMVNLCSAGLALILGGVLLTSQHNSVPLKGSSNDYCFEDKLCSFPGLYYMSVYENAQQLPTV